MIVEDITNVTTMEDELEIDQVGLGSCRLHTWVDGDTHMEEPHDEVSIIDTCVSIENLVDEPYAGKCKISFPMQGRILPWRSTMRPCMEGQESLIVAELVGGVYDLMVEGTKACDKRGT